MTVTQTQDEAVLGESVLITAERVPDDERPDFLPAFFGMQHMLRGESLVYSWMEQLAPEYRGGFWDFYELSNGAYYMAPALGWETIHICGPANFYEGDMSPEAAGIVATLYALNSLAWKTGDEWFIDLFDDLRDYAGDHAEGPAIFAAID